MSLVPLPFRRKPEPPDEPLDFELEIKLPREDVRRLRRKVNEFRGNDFSMAELIGTDFRTGIDLSLQKLPQGRGYYYVPDLARFVRIGREHLEELDDPGLREDAEIFLSIAEEDLAGGQRQALLRPKDYPASYGRGLLFLIDLWSRELE